MWIHAAVAVLITGIAVLGGKIKQFIIPFQDVKVRRFFFIAAFSGNLLGAVLTWQQIQEKDLNEKGYLEKQEYQEKEQLYAEIQGEGVWEISVEIPGRELQGELEEESYLWEDKINPQEEKKLMLQQELEAYNEENYQEDKYLLPSEIGGRTVIWSKKTEPTGGIFSILCFIGSLAAVYRKVQQEQKRLEEQRAQMLLDYPSILTKLTLFMEAGLTARKAFIKIAQDCDTKKENKRYAYEQMMIACYEMNSGISEKDAYRRFGQRCGLIQYRTLATLLIQNLKRGNQGMLCTLEKESQEAWEERKRRAKIRGEEAAVKLLFPMIMMLFVVLAILMIPAFLAFC